MSLFNVKPNEILKEIPHFRFASSPIISKCFDLSQFWLLECVEKGRVVSEATGRLLLSALLQQSTASSPSFVRIGETFTSEKFLGFSNKSEYFETFPNTATDDFKIASARAQVVLEWVPTNLRITFPGFSGYFDSVHPIERIQVRCIWPKTPRDGLNFTRQELQGAPIWVAEYEESDTVVSPLRNTMLRSIQAAHLREVLFTPMGDTCLISIQVAREGKYPKTIDSLEMVWTIMAQVYRSETERLEKDLAFRYNFIPKRVLEAMRWERLNEAFSLIWRRFIKSVEGCWNDLRPMKVVANVFGEIENGLNLVNWCIERELSWQETLKNHSLLRKLYKIPARHVYQAQEMEMLTVDEKIDKLKDRLESGFNELGRKSLSDEDRGEDEEFQDCDSFEDCPETETITKTKTILEHGYDLKGHVVYEPVTLNCEPPPTKFLTRSLLKNPLAGDVIAMNQLREDMRVFKAWNEEVCLVACKLDSNGELEIGDGRAPEASKECTIDLGFVGFLLWHSPNDVELLEGKIVISQRMRDFEGQWLKLWRESQESEDLVPPSLNKQVSFNHRALLGQVISDLILKTDLKTLLESATPHLTRKAAELLGSEAESILKEEESLAEFANENYPLDRVNERLDAHELAMSKSLTLEALCSDIFPSAKMALVSSDYQREFLLNEQHEFKVVRREIVGGDGVYRELVSGFEAVRIKLPY